MNKIMPKFSKVVGSGFICVYICVHMCKREKKIYMYAFCVCACM